MNQPKSLLRVERGERVDAPDFQFLAETELLEAFSQLGESFLIGENAPAGSAEGNLKSWVLKGFEISVVSPTVTVARGIALLAYRDRGVVRYGILTTGGDATKSLDIAAYPNTTTYSVYVRFEPRDALFENRLTWDAAQNPPVEVPRVMATRKVETWGVAIEPVSPGPEWLKIGTAAKDGGGTVTVADTRNFFFEGSAAGQHQVVEWGGGSDRSNTRATNGVFGLFRFVRAVQRQLQGIVGEASPAGWWTAIDRSLRQLVALDGSRALTGDLLPSAANVRALGSVAAYFQTLYSRIYFFPFTATFYQHVPASAAAIPTLTPVGEIQFEATDPTVVPAFPIWISMGTVAPVTAARFVYVPLRLPAFATITGLVVTMTNSGAGATRIGLFHLRSGTSAAVSMRGVGYFDPGDQSAGWADVNVTGLDTDLIVRNDLYDYIVVFKCQVGATSHLGSVRVAYTLNGIAAGAAAGNDGQGF